MNPTIALPKIKTDLIPEHVRINTLDALARCYDQWEEWLARNPEESRRVDAMAAEVRRRRAKKKTPLEG